MADVTVTISVPDIEAHALAIVAASLAQSSSSRLMNIGSIIGGGPWRTYSPQVEADMKDLMGDPAERFTRRSLTTGFDVLTMMGPR